ncbi:LysE family translocator [Oscillatoria salina]|uniref:LysE family translocator n=1 Tax=Oscillatoria salina TaxID=331517 RepID=UPI0013BE07B8|nr:LysE family transporter [Oscillatoria salina]MBZ8179345.1 LysE family transporter [Oscillatoria salina IIICB1]NET91210.1 LysE family transporter [Kamptonema sp. SIO1D9]
MEISFFGQGVAIGFAIAAPVGVIGLLCINRTLTQGYLVGFVSGLGAATADAIYGSIAGFGLSLISNFLIQQEFWLRLLGGVFLCYLGVKTFRQPPAKQTTSSNSQGWLNAYFSTFLLTLSNPTTIISFAGVFASVGLGSDRRSLAEAMALVVGVFAGSTFWWLLLCSGISLFRQQAILRRMHLLNRISGVAIVSLGLLAIFSLKI